MFMLGTSITTAADSLQSIDLPTLAQRIQAPSETIIAEIARLRAIRTIDTAQYAARKRALPYFVCATFNPACRRTENLAYIEHFVIDIDHIADKNENILDLRARLQDDSRVALCFLSPGGDGLKLVFHLANRCHDAGLFSIFYRTFATQFSLQHNLEQIIDKRTCDCTRACFLSFDPLIYHNAAATSIAITEHIDPFDEHTTWTDHQVLATAAPPPPPSRPIDPDAETLQRIKAQLRGPKAQIARMQQCPIMVPEVLNETMSEMQRILTESTIEIDEVIDIQYGKKLKVHLDMHHGEVNVFHGHRGFSVVPTPKRGCSSELNEVVTDLLKCFFGIA